jgi:hypothetical protein
MDFDPFRGIALSNYLRILRYCPFTAFQGMLGHSIDTPGCVTTRVTRYSRQKTPERTLRAQLRARPVPRCSASEPARDIDFKDIVKPSDKSIRPQFQNLQQSAEWPI